MSALAKKSKRGVLILAAGAAIQALTGIPAAWGVFHEPVAAEYRLNEAGAEWVFSLIIGAFGLGCVLGGFLQDRFGPRPAGLAGAALLTGGFAAGAAVPAGSAAVFALAFSLPVGMGCAFLYPAVMSCAQKWYADKKGLATGVIGGAAGASGAVLSLLVNGLTGRWGIRACLWVLAGVLAVVCGGGAALLKNPPQTTKQPAASPADGQDYTPARMLRTRQYWLCVTVVAMASPAVLLFSPILLELGRQRGLPDAWAALPVAVGSVGSAAGRLLMPLLSDRLGRRRTYLGLFAALAGLSVAFAFARGGWFVAGYTALTFCYSGQAALLPALGTDLFGMPHAGVNYGFLALGMSAGGLAFPLAARALHWQLARHWVAVAAAAAGFVCLLALRPTGGKGGFDKSLRKN